MTAPDPRAAAIRFCPRCGQAMRYEPRYGRVRPVCGACRYIHFIDPKVAVCVLVERAGALLMIRRRGDPERGKWSFPAGFMDADEDPAQAAAREALEETGLEVRVTALLDAIPRRDAHEGADLLLVYRAEIVGGRLAAGDDAERAEFFTAEQIPAELAFTSTKLVLARWLAHEWPAAPGR